MRRKNSDLIADVIWWLRGFYAATLDAPYGITRDHIEALTEAKHLAEIQEEAKHLLE